MQLCRVTGNAVATVKAPALRDFKLLRVRAEEKGAVEFVAVDTLGAGEGDLVLVALGTAARELEATAVAVGARAMIERAIEENTSMILEGVSILPGAQGNRVLGNQIGIAGPVPFPLTGADLQGVAAGWELVKVGEEWAWAAPAEDVEAAPPADS